MEGKRGEGRGEAGIEELRGKARAMGCGGGQGGARECDSEEQGYVQGNLEERDVEKEIVAGARAGK